MKRIMILMILSLLYLFDIWVGFTHFGGQNNSTYRNIGFFVGQIAAIIAGLYTLRIVGIKSAIGKTVLFFTLGLCAECIGSSIFAINQFLYHKAQIFSVSDIFFLSGYPLYFLSLFSQVRGSHFNLSPTKKVGIGALFLLLTALVVYFGMIIPFDSTASILITLLQILYQIADLVLIAAFIFVLLWVMDYQGGKFFYPWIFLFLGMLATLCGDILLAIFSQQYVAQNGVQIPIDLIWRAAYIFYGYGLFQFGYYISSIQHDIQKKLDKQQEIAPK